MAKKYIDAEKLAKAIEDKGLNCSFALKMERLDTLALIDELQQEQPEKSKVDSDRDFSKAWAIHPIPKEFIHGLLEERGSLEFIYKTARHFYELGKNSK